SEDRSGKTEVRSRESEVTLISRTSPFETQTSKHPPTRYGVRTTKYRLRTSVFRLPSSVFRLPSSDFRLRSSDFRLRTPDFQLPTPFRTLCALNRIKWHLSNLYADLHPNSGLIVFLLITPPSWEKLLWETTARFGSTPCCAATCIPLQSETIPISRTV